MTSKGKNWNWADDAKGRKTLSEGMTKRLKDGLAVKAATKHGLSRHPSYNSWKKMMQRCYHENNPSYDLYGGRGIQVCERWHDVSNFIEDMGEKPDKCSIERIDVNGNYEPGNCTWIPMRLQSKNRRKWKHSEEGKQSIAESCSKRFKGRKRESKNGKWL